MEPCNYQFKQGWTCSRSRFHDGPCCLTQNRTLKVRLKNALRELLTK